MPTQPPQTDSDSGDSWDGAVPSVAVEDEPRKPQTKRKLEQLSDGEDVGSESEEEEDTTGEDTESEAEAPAPKKKGPPMKKPKQPAANKPEAATKKPEGPAKKKAKAKGDPPRSKAADGPSTAPAATKARRQPPPGFFTASPLSTDGAGQTRPGCTPEEEVATLQAYIEGETDQHKAKMDRLIAAATNDKGKVPKALASPHLPPTFLAPLLTGNF